MWGLWNMASMVFDIAGDLYFAVFIWGNDDIGSEEKIFQLLYLALPILIASFHITYYCANYTNLFEVGSTLLFHMGNIEEDRQRRKSPLRCLCIVFSVGSCFLDIFVVPFKAVFKSYILEFLKWSRPKSEQRQTQEKKLQLVANNFKYTLKAIVLIVNLSMPFLRRCHLCCIRVMFCILSQLSVLLTQMEI